MAVTTSAGSPGALIIAASLAALACDDDRRSSDPAMDPTAGASVPGDGGGAEGEGSGGTPASACGTAAIELEDVVLEATTNRILGEDVAADFDPSAGSYACVQVDGQRVSVSVWMGPFDHPQVYVQLLVRDGMRAYDIATEEEVIEFRVTHEIDTTSYVFGTDTHDAEGTVDVVALPLEGGASVEFSAVGEIGGSDGWVFDLHFVASVPAA